MEDLAMHDRMMDIYQQQAAMGGCNDQYLVPDPYNRMGMGYDDDDDDDDMLGGYRKKRRTSRGRKRPLTAYQKFVQQFAKKSGRNYRTPQAMVKAAAAAWRKSGRAGPKKRKTRKSYSGSKTRKVTRRRKLGRPRGSGVLVGGALYKPSKSQLDNLGMSESEFYKLLNVEDMKAKRPKLFNETKLRRVGKRYSRVTRRGDCYDQNDEGSKWIDRDYKCVDWNKLPKSKLLEVLQNLNPDEQENFIEMLKKKQ
jgi:hypothetical protein